MLAGAPCPFSSEEAPYFFFFFFFLHFAADEALFFLPFFFFLHFFFFFAGVVGAGGGGVAVTSVGVAMPFDSQRPPGPLVRPWIRVQSVPETIVGAGSESPSRR